MQVPSAWQTSLGHKDKALLVALLVAQLLRSELYQANFRQLWHVYVTLLLQASSSVTGKGCRDAVNGTCATCSNLRRHFVKAMPSCCLHELRTTDGAHAKSIIILEWLCRNVPATQLLDQHTQMSHVQSVLRILCDAYVLRRKVIPILIYISTHVKRSCLP